MSSKQVNEILSDESSPMSEADAIYESWDDGVARGTMLARFIDNRIGGLAERRVLDIGCAAGGISLAFSEYAAEVVGCDLSWHEVERARDRNREKDPNRRARFLNAGGAELPFPDQSFDIVLLIGVLEYLGRSQPDRAPRAAQQYCLEGIARVLSESGRVIIAIENRWYPPFLVRSPHQFLRGALALPQALAPTVVRRMTGERLWEALHGYGALRRLLLRAGFQHVNGFLPIYGYQFPKAIVPIDDRKELWRMADRFAVAGDTGYKDLSRGGRWGPVWFRLLALLGLQKILAPSLLLIGSKE